MLDNTTQEGKTSLLRVMGLWENTDKRGNKYLSGNIGSLRVMIFSNSFKQGEREPDYILYVSQRSQDERSGGQTPQFENEQPRTQPEDDIPF
jgi:hypothetical protein